MSAERLLLRFSRLGTFLSSVCMFSQIEHMEIRPIGDLNSVLDVKMVYVALQ